MFSNQYFNYPVLDGLVTKMLPTHTSLDIGPWQPLARGASESENPLAPQKTHWPPKNM